MIHYFSKKFKSEGVYNTWSWWKSDLCQLEEDCNSFICVQDGVPLHCLDNVIEYFDTHILHCFIVCHALAYHFPDLTPSDFVGQYEGSSASKPVGVKTMRNRYPPKNVRYRTALELYKKNNFKVCSF